MKVWFGSVIYKEAEDYFEDFINSLKKQSEKGFEVFFLNDNYTDGEIKKLGKKMEGLKRDGILKPSKKMTPVRLRIELLRRAKKDGVDLLVLGDCDDYFSEDRMESMKKAYIKDPDAAFYYNPIRSFAGNPVMGRLPDAVYDYRNIGECNFLGLSNTAINLSAFNISEIDSMDEFDGKVFDWYFFSRILLLGKYGIKADGGETFYRIHAGNIAGTPEHSKDKIQAEIEIKRNHYYWLRKYSRYYEEKYEQYCNCDRFVVPNKDCSKFWWDLTVCR